MAVKTLTIDLDAYRLLAADKRAGESFSKVIKRRMREAKTADDLLRDLDRALVAEDTLDALDKVVESRSESLADSPVLESR
mgnify:CR=1 FL=1